VAFYLWFEILEKQLDFGFELGSLLFNYEFIYTFASCKTGKFTFNVRIPSSVKLTSRQFAGVMMLGIGIWYLGFGNRWITRYRGGDDVSRPSDLAKHLITGTQVYSY
jgi:hypothetical protein